MANIILQDMLDDVAELQIVEANYMRKNDYDVDDNEIVDEAELIDGGSF